MPFIEISSLQQATQHATQQAPECGLRIVFFTGGTALCALSKELCSVTHNSVHLVTPFDSGGSSASLRDAFHMPAVGDVRNRLLALADTNHTSPALLQLLHSRLSAKEQADESTSEQEGKQGRGQAPRLVSYVYTLVSKKHPIWQEMPVHLAETLRTYLLCFLERIPPAFDARRASIGNLVLAGAYLQHNRQWKPAINMFSRLLRARGTVLPISTSNAHLGATLTDGHVLVREHCIAERQVEHMQHIHMQHTSPRSQTSTIKQLFFIPQAQELRYRSGDFSPTPCQPRIYSEAAAHIRHAEAICYPMGSFYTSIIANLLPVGVGKAVAQAQCPKIYIPNVGHDAEQAQLSVADTVHVILKSLRKDAGCVPTHSLLHAVIVDPEGGHYPNGIDKEGIEAQGVRLVSLPLVRDKRDNWDSGGATQEHDAKLTLNALLHCVETIQSAATSARP